MSVGDDFIKERLVNFPKRLSALMVLHRSKAQYGQ
jgi:hypothetical protein